MQSGKTRKLLGCCQQSMLQLWCQFNPSLLKNRQMRPNIPISSTSSNINVHASGNGSHLPYPSENQIESEYSQNLPEASTDLEEPVTVKKKRKTRK